MKNTTPLAPGHWCALTLIFFFFVSCKKDSNPGGPQGPQGPTGTLAIDLSYHANNPDPRNFELIISGKGDTILLDTIGMVDTKIVASIKTNDQSFNVTVIHYDSIGGQYTANTYTNVNPSTWTTIANGYPAYITQTIYEPPFTPATLHYYNAPAGQPYFINGPAPEIPTITVGAGAVDISYDRHTGAYAYLLFPTPGLYNLRLPATDADSVDLTHMDTTVNVNYTKPPGYQLVFTNLNGYTDSTDLTKYLWLYFSPNFNDGYDLEYPRKLMQKYEFSAAWENTSNRTLSYYSFNDTVPGAASIPFVDESNYSIGSSQSDSFAIQFINAHPSYYETQWTIGKISWNIFSSSDSTVQHPSHLFTAQKSRLMKTQNLSGFTLSEFQFENAQITDYATYLAYIFNPALLNKKLMRSTVSFGKTF